MTLTIAETLQSFCQNNEPKYTSKICSLSLQNFYNSCKNFNIFLKLFVKQFIEIFRFTQKKIFFRQTDLISLFFRKFLNRMPKFATDLRLRLEAWHRKQTMNATGRL